MSQTSKIVPANKIGYDKKVFKANMDMLKRRYPKLHEQIKRVNISDKYGLALYKKRTPNLYIKVNGSYEPVYGQEHPEKFAIEQCQQQFKPHSKTVVFLGMGLFYHVNGFLQKEESKETHSTIFMEKDLELFKVALGVSNITSLLNKRNAHFFVGLEPDLIYSTMWNFFMEKQWLVLHARSTNYIVNEVLFQQEKDYYLKTVKSINEALFQCFVFFGNDPYDSLLGIEHMFLNLKNIIQYPGVNHFFDQFKNIPAVIASTGPSLNKQIPLLKKIQGKAMIFAPDASLGPLLREGIRPNFITTLERVPLTVKLLEPYDFGDDINFVPVPVVVPEMYEACNGQIFNCYRAFNHFRWLEIDRGLLWIKGSAGNMSYNLATALGCNPIILVGQDHAYGDGFVTHAENSTLGTRQGSLPSKKNMVKLPGYYGGEVYSTSVWQLFRNHYITDIADNNAKGVITINATEGGASIDGASHIPFADAVASYIDHRDAIDFTPLIREQHADFHVDLEQEKSRIHRKLQRAINVAERSIYDLLDCIDKVRAITEKYRDYVYGEVGIEDLDAEEIHRVYYDVEKMRVSTRPTDNTDYTALVLHVIQPYMIQYESQYSNMPEAFDDPVEGQLNAVLVADEYFVKVVQLTDIVRRNLMETQAGMERPFATVLPGQGKGANDTILWRNRFDNDFFHWRLQGEQVECQQTKKMVGGSLLIEEAGVFGTEGQVQLLLRNKNIFNPQLDMLPLNFNGETYDPANKIADINRQWQIQSFQVAGREQRDIFMRSTADDKVVLWLMDGHQPTGIYHLGTVSPQMELVAVGDFGGSGTDQILWRDQAEEKFRLWSFEAAALQEPDLEKKEELFGVDVLSLEGRELVIETTVQSEIPMEGWRYAGKGRFIQSDVDELLWQHFEERTLRVCNLQDASNSDFAGPGASWQIDAIGRFQDTSRDQILWGDNETHNLELWKLDSPEVDKTSVGSRPGSWKPRDNKGGAGR
ncbi:motility associated factor glycosyltransferase family protein [Desulfurispira natronophila]|uniref:6-hydroxymethylpterin diphosphokinase MptE-like domain-containing protein n=1 Tax=Desulfurispira natronophila TaxID=682562 RepID=A0A7W7Y4R2_9BACT|nr:6-hydroxymethylpterin diphosphokinase MptE-like protein [Desulfurispira natronophila]MBB5022058.1 hypothetical protein [Desulfurispira natronophila]